MLSATGFLIKTFTDKTFSHSAQEHTLVITSVVKISGVGSKRLVTGSLDGKICVWLLKKSKVEHADTLADHGEERVERLLKLHSPIWKHQAQIRALSFEPKQKLLFVAMGPMSTILLYSMETMTQRGVLRYLGACFGGGRYNEITEPNIFLNQFIQHESLY